MHTTRRVSAATLLVLALSCSNAGTSEEIDDGVARSTDPTYTDFGPAPETSRFRALIGFRVRNGASLASAIRDIHDPSHPSFRKYYSKEAWIFEHAPLAEDVDRVRAWLTDQGMEVPRVSENRLLLEFTGTVGDFNRGFETELRLLEREDRSQTAPPMRVYGVARKVKMPRALAPVVSGVASLDLPPASDPLSKEIGTPENAPPADTHAARSVMDVARSYGLSDLYKAGHAGRGVRIGIVVGHAFRFNDLQTFWQSMGVARKDPEVVTVMEPISSRNSETTLDVEWAGGLAPESDLVVYEGPDTRDTSLLYTYNDAIARGEVSVLSYSFAHAEYSVPRLVAEQFNASSMMGAALGMTILVAAGDSSQIDVPSSSPYVTAVGGTKLTLDDLGGIESEVAWSDSGSGVSAFFPIPYWQVGIVSDSNGMRANADLALNASSKTPYYFRYLGKWDTGGGTSFAAPCMAGIVAVINSARLARGLPFMGFFNPILYASPEVRGSFRDITTGGTSDHKAGLGWDYPTGWGAPDAKRLAELIP